MQMGNASLGKLPLIYSTDYLHMVSLNENMQLGLKKNNKTDTYFD